MMLNFPAYGKGFVYIFHPSIITSNKKKKNINNNKIGISINVLYILQKQGKVSLISVSLTLFPSVNIYCLEQTLSGETLPHTKSVYSSLL